MSILDDAIREHLELKRAHGADEAEVKRLEDEAFGPPSRPDDADPFAEAPTEFLTAPATDADEAAADAGRRVPNIADLQEAPPSKAPEHDDALDDVEEPPADEAAPAVEQTIPVPHPETEIEAGHSTEERHAIAEQPTEFFDVEADLDAGSESRSLSDEELVDAELAEPRLAPVDPLHGLVDTGPDAELAEDEEEEDDFFSEQRLSDELNRALEAPLTEEEEQIFAPATDEHPAPAPPAEDEEPLGSSTDEHEAIPPAEEATAIYEIEEDADDEEDDVEPPPPAATHRDHDESEHEDVLEDTPDFLEDAPEDDDLWFEQKPPKDFDFDD